MVDIEAFRSQVIRGENATYRFEVCDGQVVVYPGNERGIYTSTELVRDVDGGEDAVREAVRRAIQSNLAENVRSKRSDISAVASEIGGRVKRVLKFTPAEVCQVENR
jgi:hypothetical protein